MTGKIKLIYLSNRLEIIIWCTLRVFIYWRSLLTLIIDLVIPIFFPVSHVLHTYICMGALL